MKSMDEKKIQARRREQDEKATRQRAAILGLAYIDTRPFEQTLELVPDVLSNEQMYKGHIVPLTRNEMYQFGVTSQTPKTLIDKMREEYSDRGESTEFLLISESGFRVFMQRYDPPKTVIYDNIEIAKEGDSDTLGKVSQTLNSVRSDAVFDYLLDQADLLGASDIHIENERSDIRIRMRVDGALHPVAILDRDRYRLIMGELASRAGISLASSDPQSGHMQKDIVRDDTSHLLNLRVETVPTLYGQDAVLRLFNFDESLLQLDLLGIAPDERKQIDEVISHPRGMVLMVGPTGSGKSTTLYSMLNALNTPDRKLLTLEDPIEYGLPGITQIPIDTTSGHTFGESLRAVLRLDPDVVMIGEIRDEDTARTAIQASITGHLLLSSFHANSAAAAFSRMIDLVGQNPIFSSAVRLVIAQRLVRKLTDKKEAYKPDETTTRWIKEVLKDLPDRIEQPDFDNLTLYRPVPSDDAPFGYKGRMVITEQLVVGEEVQKFIRGDVHETHTEDIEAAAKREGMVTLLQSGVLASLRGETTLEEINRVV